MRNNYCLFSLNSKAIQFSTFGLPESNALYLKVTICEAKYCRCTGCLNITIFSPPTVVTLRHQPPQSPSRSVRPHAAAAAAAASTTHCCLSCQHLSLLGMALLRNDSRHVVILFLSFITRYCKQGERFTDHATALKFARYLFKLV